MIGHFFEESIGKGHLAVSTLHDKVENFLRRDFTKNVEAMQ
jgi:hypothetical protein